jgi:putative radical SAM enzyme (TIGR03279 family)
MKIKAFEQDSLAAEAGLKIDDDLIIINDEPIRDLIDFRFHVADEILDIEVLRQGNTLFFEIEKDYNDNLGIIFEEIKYRCCGNDCIFCFIDQNPTGLRNSLYFKDEDFRLSFMYGNYVTLTNVSQNDLKRIVQQRLSPLYVSVHSTDLEIRKLLLGLKKDDRLLKKIEFLADNSIELHVQIVLCPSINNGESLIKTINDLARFYPMLKTIAVVPVGLTKHRENLYPITPVTTDYASDLIAHIEPIALQFKKKRKDYFIYLADEFYLLAGIELPPAKRYGEFFQIENGVGMTRDFLDRFQEQSQHFPHRINTSLSMTLVSGQLAAPVISRWIIPVLNKIENLAANVVTVPNNFYGTSVTVTGLLTGQDIYAELSKHELGDIILLPANTLNFDGIFLDDWTIEMLQEKLGRPIEVVDYNFDELIKKL